MYNEEVQSAVDFECLTHLPYIFLSLDQMTEFAEWYAITMFRSVETINAGTTVVHSSIT